ncbi:TadE/TadG family type IV pilus assembly protein [Bradyrhizobium sp. HKCCYLS20291]|uniref:TadE/TadG family type IV pilus assembly protein n=1 Tax=Bradyrhizobium sp. HKCCYLS20291 TaxID=3420766 RepID=UPI003EBD01D8
MRWLFDHLRRFRRDQRGNIAITFAIACVPLLAFIGAGVDYSMANRLRTKLQMAVDEAVLAGVAAGKAALDSGASQSAAIAKANAAASAFFSGNTEGMSATPTLTFTVSGRKLSGVGSASSAMNTSFMRIAGLPTMQLSAQSKSSATMQPYVNVYLLVDISSSMLLPATQAGITQMNNGTGCTLACHETTDGTDSYSYALKNNVLLRYQVVNQGVQKLLTYLNGSSVYKNYVKVGLWSFDNQLTQMSPLTSNFTSVGNNFPAPGLAYNDAAAATPFDSLIDSFVSTVGTGGDGSTSATPQKMVIIATDGVNDPTRAWTSQTSLRSQVRVFNTGFCTSLTRNSVTIAIINTPYYPMPWDWGYKATLGQPGSLGGATRVDDIPIALKACAGDNFLAAADLATIQDSFTYLFSKAAPVRLTN